jgi:hypothetical protein
VARGPGVAGLQLAQRRLSEALGQRENSGLERGGAGVKGFATVGATGSKAGTGGSDIAIGALLILGLLTGAADLLLNIMYMFSGSSGVNPAYAIIAVFLILAWRNVGYLGLDRFALPLLRDRFHHRAPARDASIPAADHRALVTGLARWAALLFSQARTAVRQRAPISQADPPTPGMPPMTGTTEPLPGTRDRRAGSGTRWLAGHVTSCLRLPLHTRHDDLRLAVIPAQHRA